MDLRVLGPIEIQDGGDVRVPTRRMSRLLLGVLSLRANRAVPVDWIIDTLWNGRPPRSAAANVRSHVAELRRLMRPAGQGGPRIYAGRVGYTLVADTDSLDVLAFDALVEQGRGLLATGQHHAGADRFARALRLWRGPVLQGLPVPYAIRAEVSVLESRRLDAVEERIEARLALGEHADLVTELPLLTAEYGLRERLWGQLMLALYRCGRQAEALATYHALYRLLDDELGVRPGSATRRLHERILASDPDLDLLTPAPALGTASSLRD